LLIVGCAASQRPIQDSDRIGSARALDTAFRVVHEIVVPAPLGIDYVLPVGEYRPTHIDVHGIFYASPTGVTARKGDEHHVLPGGIHMASRPGRYDSFPSLYVDFGSGTFSKYPLPEDLAAQVYGTSVVFVVGGEEVR
jgi:hypothetical protein